MPCILTAAMIVCMFFGRVVNVSFNIEQSRDLRENLFEKSLELKQDVNTNERTIDSITIIAFMRPDFIRRILLSIDFPVRKLVVVLNKHDEETSKEIISTVNNFVYNQTSNIWSTHIVEPGVNSGYAGAVNLGLKVMVECDLRYTLFLNDDTVLLPGALERIWNAFTKYPSLCIYHFSKYVLWGLTLQSFHLLGYMDELLWPAYMEDCDYHFRAQVIGCTNFYANKSFKYVEHGDYIDPPGQRRGATTRRKNPLIAKLLSGVHDQKRGAAAYLFQKWGPEDSKYRTAPLAKRRSGTRTNVCTEMHENLDEKHGKEVRMSSKKPLKMFSTPYNNKSLSIKDWKRNWSGKRSISSRSVNAAYAPKYFQAD